MDYKILTSCIISKFHLSNQHLATIIALPQFLFPSLEPRALSLQGGLALVRLSYNVSVIPGSSGKS